MAHKYEHISTGEGFKVLNNGTETAVINQDGSLSSNAASHSIKFAGEETWTGGLATLAVTVTGALATDIVLANFQTIGTEGTVVAAVVTADTVTFTLDAANTSNDAVISYQVLRANT